MCLVALYATNMWRFISVDGELRVSIRNEQDLNNPVEWGHGQHIFEAIAKGSPSTFWLEQNLTALSSATQSTKS